MPPLFRLYSNPFNSSGLDVVVVMRPKVIDKTITPSIMQSDSNCFIQHYKSLARISMTIVCVKPPAHVKNSFIKQQQSDTAYHAKENLLCIRSPHPELDSGSGLLPKCIGDFLVQGYICDKNFHENPIRRYKPNCGKNALSRNVEEYFLKCLDIRIRRRMTSKILPCP